MIPSVRLIILLVWLCGTCGAQTLIPARLDSLLQRGSQELLQGTYDNAQSIFARVSVEFPSSGAGPLFLAACLTQRADDLTEAIREREIDSLLTLVEVRATENGTDGAQDVWNRMFRATAKGMMVLDAVRRGAWISAVRDAVNSGSLSRSAFASDSTMADAGLTLGSYLYWRSRKTEAIHWLPFISDQRDEGIELLERCVRRGRYHVFGAVNALVWIEIDAGRLEKAAQWVRMGLAAYPGNRVFLRGQAAIQERMRQYVVAADTWRVIGASLRSSDAGRSVACFSAFTAEARCRVAAADFAGAERALTLAQQATPSTVPAAWTDRMSSKKIEWNDLAGRVREHLSAAK